MCVFPDGTNALLYRRTAAVTATVLKEYKEMIANTTTDLEDHLQKIDNKLDSFSLQDMRISDEGTAERQQMQEERDSTQQCLGICAKVSAHIDQLQPIVSENISTPLPTYQGPVATLNGFTPARIVTVDTFKACKERLTSATTQLEKHLQNINNRLQHFSLQPLKVSNEHAAEKERIEEELAGIKQCLAICADASKQAEKGTNVFEDVAQVDDGYQVIISTIGDLVSAKRVNSGSRTMQLLGQMSDDSLQQLSRDFGHGAKEKATEPQTGKGTHFEDRHGAGVKLSQHNLKDVDTTRK
jgi:DNA repair exonuclease SbcCD ATPase subunit